MAVYGNFSPRPRHLRCEDRQGARLIRREEPCCSISSLARLDGGPSAIAAADQRDKLAALRIPIRANKECLSSLIWHAPVVRRVRVRLREVQHCLDPLSVRLEDLAPANHDQPI